MFVESILFFIFVFLLSLFFVSFFVWEIMPKIALAFKMHRSFKKYFGVNIGATRKKRKAQETMVQSKLLASFDEFQELFGKYANALLLYHNEETPEHKELMKNERENSLKLYVDTLRAAEAARFWGINTKLPKE